MISSGVSPPWTVQQSIVNELETKANKMLKTSECADSHLQLSLCFETGFGVEPDVAKVLHHLRKRLHLIASLPDRFAVGWR